MPINGIAAVIVAYLLGAIPSAYILTRLLRGKDIRKLGGGNVGARNVLREVGLWPGIIVAVFDTSKGFVAIAIAHILISIPMYESQIMRLVTGPHLFIFAAGLAAVFGHIWPIYIKFRGGQGIATIIGIVLGLIWREFLIALVVMVLLRTIIRNFGMSFHLSLLISLPVSSWFIEKELLPVIYTIILGVISLIHFRPRRKITSTKAG
ncbi:glycerol-3-phosphate acyltransferase [Chloroflexota bacterium]